MCTMIGQFSRLRLAITVELAKFNIMFQLKSPPSIWIQEKNKYLTNLVQGLYCKLQNLGFSLCICDPSAFVIWP